MPLLTLSVIVLLPIIPAALLFLVLPTKRDQSTGQVTGKLYGLEIKVGGAFAGYLIVLWVVLNKHEIWDPKPSLEPWQVVGRLVASNGQAIPMSSPQDVAKAPPTEFVYKDGSFQFVVAAGSGNFPKLIFQHDGYKEANIPLDPNTPCQSVKRMYDNANRKIDLGDIPLSEIAPYAPVSSQTPVTVTPEVHP